MTVSGRLAARIVPAEPDRWCRWGDVEALFTGRADPDWARDQGLVDDAVVEQLQSLRQGHRYADTDPDTPRGQFQCDALPARPAPISIEERLTVLMAVEELSERERRVVLGTFAAGLSQSEIAMTLGLSQSQISKILSRALGKLQRRVA